jgi:hypothetical protein
MKIFNLGAHKTGTASLSAVMEDLGYKCCPGSKWYSNPELKEQVYNGDYSGALSLIDEDYEFYNDSPFNLNDIYKHIPREGNKFILTMRDPDKWFDSFKRWVKHGVYKDHDIPDTIYGYGGEIVEENREMITSRYRKRIGGIMCSFGADLCVLDVENPYNGVRLSVLLNAGKHIEWPHLNKTKG